MYYLKNKLKRSLPESFETFRNTNFKKKVRCKSADLQTNHSFNVVLFIFSLHPPAIYSLTDKSPLSKGIGFI